MHKTLLLSAAVLGLMAGTALAQTTITSTPLPEVGTGNNPHSKGVPPGSEGDAAWSWQTNTTHGTMTAPGMPQTATGGDPAGAASLSGPSAALIANGVSQTGTGNDPHSKGVPPGTEGNPWPPSK